MAESNGLSFETIADMALAVLPDIRAEVNMTQTYPNYPACKELIPWLDDEGVENNTYGEQIHMRQSVGATQKHRPYARHNAKHGNYLVRNSVEMCHRVNTAVSIDMIEDSLNAKGDPSRKLAAILPVREGARTKEVWDGREEDFLGKPESATEENAFWSLLYWFGASVDGSGNFVEQTTPAFVGTRTRYSDGTVGNVFGKQAVNPLLLENKNYRSMLFTHNNIVDETFIDNWVEASELQGWEKISTLKGNLRSPSWFAIMPTVMQKQIRSIANSMGSDDGDVYKNRVAKIMGQRIHRSLVLDNDPSHPCMCINKHEIRLKKVKGMWDKYVDKERIGTTSYMFPMAWSWQLFVASRRSMGFMAHSTW